MITEKDFFVKEHFVLNQRSNQFTQEPLRASWGDKEKIGLDVVRFRAGAYTFAMEARLVRAMRTTPPAEGMDFESLPIEDLIGLSNIEPQEVQLNAFPNRKWLWVTAGKTAIWVAVSEPILLDSLPVREISELPILIASRITLKGVRALAVDPKCGLVLLIDPRKIFLAPINEHSS
jgi:hypothetical protein